ncbi:MAG: hypothetical protein KJ587_09895 [Alphaproteobacteria bacterium]|nr:hypothetical protein [Alphaproteobacteria bacterium]
MTDKKSTPGKNQTPPADGAGGKKPHATLDLKATEVKPAASSDNAKPAAASSGSTPGTFTSIPRPGEKPADDRPTASASSAKPADPLKSAEPSKAQAAKPETSKPASAPPPPRQRSSGSGIGSFFSHIVAGLVGGFLMLLGADALQPQIAELKTGLGLSEVGSKADGAMANLSERLAALEAAQGNAGGGDAQALAAQLAETEAKFGELEALKGTVASLKSTQEELAQATTSLREQVGQKGAGGSVPDERLAKLEQQLSTMTAFAESNENSGIVPRLASLTGRMADLEETLKNQIAAVRSGVSEDVETRLAKVAETSEAARSGTQRMDRQLSGVANDTARLSQQIESVKADTTRLGDTLRVVQEETARINSQLAGLEGDVTSRIAKLASPGDVDKAVKPVAEQVSSLESQVANVVSAEKDRARNAKRIVLALELGGLTRAIERGDGFADELAQVRQTAGGLIDVSKLEPFEAKGVASVAKLQAMFSPVADAILEASSAPVGDSVFDQLLANARSVVKIRKVSVEPDDKTPEATVARMENALAAGRLDEVLRLAGELPESGRKAADGWLKKVEERHGVDQALALVEEQLKASLSGTN